QPKAAPIPPAPVPAQPILTTQAPAAPPPATPNALDALQHDDGQLIATDPPAPVAMSPAPDQAQEAGAPPEAQGGQVYLPFGAFSGQQAADNLAQKLNPQIRGVESRPAHVQASSNLYRVQIGPYPSRTAAVNAALRIQQETGQQPSM